MKNLAKHLTMLMALMLIMEAGAVMAQSRKKKDKEEKPVEAIYFHNTRRCGWCVNLQNSSKTAIDELYAEELQKGTVKFITANLQQPEGAELARRFNISSVSFVVVSGDESTNLTQAGLMGRRDPEAFKKAIKETVDAYLDKK
jgi:hypothetical protein